MLNKQIKLLTMVAVITVFGFQCAWAGDIRVTFPKRSHLTPVQRLNREGVNAIRKQQYEKAEAIFYKAYLYDSTDPFTLNNLGYISELQGKLGRAQKFYALASEQNCDALIDISSSKQLEGKPMTYALTGLKNTSMRVNHLNIQAMELVAQGRNFEATTLLQKALLIEPRNPFTLNNLGVVEEATGDFQRALEYYDEAAGLHSPEPIVVTLKRSWRGKPVSERAANSTQQLRKRMQGVNAADARATMLTLRGVAATNRNDWRAAKQDFLQAYSLDPNNAFSLNNLGYVAEKDGDLETAHFYYAKARKANDADARIGLATQRSAEGKHLVSVARKSDLGVDREIDQYSQTERMQTEPVQLIHRDNTHAKTGVSPNPPSATISLKTWPQTLN